MHAGLFDWSLLTTQCLGHVTKKMRVQVTGVGA